MISRHADLFDPPPLPADDIVKPQRPKPLTHEEWAKRDYRKTYAWRMETLSKLRADASLLASAKAYYAEHPIQYICDWAETYDPRRKRGRWMPFILFQKQAEFIQFMEEMRRDNESGLVEKCRDVGASWLGCAYSVWLMIFHPDVAIGWGSRKEALVDKKGDPDSLFEKMRMLIQRTPDVFRPATADAFLKIVNKDNGSTVTGEAGDGIGRGGRKTMFCVDEAAHIERAELIEASLADTTDCRIDLSSVNGTGNMFHRRREAGQVWTPGARIEPGVIRVFIFDWRDHPDKDQEWYDKRKAKAEREGLQHVFAQEVERNYSAAVENTLISGDWITAAIDAHLAIPSLAAIADSDEWMAGLDLADEGLDKNALVIRQGVIVRHVEEWSERDPGVTTRRMIQTLRDRNMRGIAVQYDSIGIGATVKSEYNRLVEGGDLSAADIRLVPWNAGSAVIRPYERIIPDDTESMTNRAFFHNFKAQAWWALRTRFYKTWRARQFGEVYPAHELISIDSAIGTAAMATFRKELAQAQRTMSAGSLKMLVLKTPQGTKSPNTADGCVQAFFPAPESGTEIHVGSYGG